MTHGFKKGHQELDNINEKIINQRKDLLLYIQNLVIALESQIKAEKNEIHHFDFSNLIHLLFYLLN